MSHNPSSTTAYEFLQGATAPCNSGTLRQFAVPYDIGGNSLWLVLGLDPLSSEWSKALVEQVQSDRTLPLRARGHGAAAMRKGRTLGQLSFTLSYESAAEEGSRDSISLSTTAVVVLVDKRNAPIGYVNVEFTWFAFEKPRAEDPPPSLDVLINEVWLSPARRGLGWSRHLAEAVIATVYVLEDGFKGGSTVSRQGIALTYAYDDKASVLGQRFKSLCETIHQAYVAKQQKTEQAS